MLAATLVWSVAGGCSSGPTDAELRFLDAVRNAEPSLSVDRVSDDRLLALADGACSADGLSDAEQEALTALGIGVEPFVVLAQPLCPSR